MMEVEIRFPLWALGTKGRRTRGLVRGTDPDGIKGVFLFNDGALAQAYLNADARLKGYELRVIVDELALLGFLTLLEKEGFENVIYNPVPGNTTGKFACEPVTKLRAETASFFD